VKPFLLAALLLAAVGPRAFAQMPHDPTATAAPVGIFAGGVSGAADLVDPAHSVKFRTSGGGLYLHNSGWGSLTPAQKAAVLQTWRGSPVMIELGFGGTPARARTWGEAYKSHYGDMGIHPAYIAANAFAGDNHPTPAQWTAYMAALRASGVPSTTIIMPTFEYQNFKDSIPTLLDNEVSKSAVFQALITSAGGIVLDTPSGYFFGREENYRTWVVDAIQWTRNHHLRCIVIVSPHSSKTHWDTDAARYLAYLHDHAALPTDFAVENYSTAGPGYPNPVGSEDAPNTALGVALAYTRLLVPKTLPN